MIRRETYQQQESKSVLEKLYGNSIKNFVAALYQGENVNEKQLKELQEFLQEMEEG